MFDARILDEHSITHAQLRVYLAVMAAGAWDGRHWTPIKTKPLAEGLGVSQRTVYAALRNLTALGYLDRTRVGRWTLIRRFSALDWKGTVVDDYEQTTQIVTASSPIHNHQRLYLPSPETYPLYPSMDQLGFRRPLPKV
ncbi:MAG TPA: helix-turn-helix domain-containing protein [Ktedonobacterales bacterium]|nr:helix-turn-helix domain-containing protein [Ktedonobacterales bacterium]